MRATFIPRRAAADLLRLLLPLPLLASFVPLLLPAAADASPAAAAEPADNQLTARENADGWRLLFDGRTSRGWSISGRPVPRANVTADGALNPVKAGEGRPKYVIVTDESFGDFVLRLDFKVSGGCNSGVFFRVADPEDPVQTGLEMQIFDSYPWGRDENWTRIKKPDDAKYYGSGALYAAKEPSANAMKPAGEWNHAEITAIGPRVTFVLNGQTVLDADLDDWTTAGRNPDGTENKYERPLKDFPRAGRIGLQDHNKVGSPEVHDVWFKNIKIKPLARAGEGATDGPRQRRPNAPAPK